MPSKLFPDSVQKAFIGTELNTTTLVVFLWGIYTVVYIGTLYIYLTRNSSRHKFIVCAISLSYCAYSTVAILEWYHDHSALVNHSETRDALFAALFAGSQWPIVVTDIMDFIMAAVADGILVRRGEHPAERFLAMAEIIQCSVDMALLPCLRGFIPCIEKVSTTTHNIQSLTSHLRNIKVIDAVILSIWGAQHLKPAVSKISLLNRLLSAQSFITFATTLSSTILIAYRIYSTTREIPGESKQVLNRILESLVQSAAAYSLAAIAVAISSVVPQIPSNFASWDAAEDYTAAMFDFISGIAPTTLVARVAMLGENDVYASSAVTMSRPLSRLQFHVRSTQDDEDSRSQLSERISRLEGTLDGSLPVSVQRGLISDELNSTILYVFLWGIYTVVYAGTLYLYFTKKSSRSQVIVWAISLPYWAYSTIGVVNWYHDQWAVVNHSETRDTLFASLLQGPRWSIFVTDVLESAMAIVADGILIWRCYNVCGHSLHAILVSGILLFCEIVVDLVVLSFNGADHLEPSPSRANLINRLLAVQGFVTFATTLSSTALIAYKIYTTSKQKIPRSSKRLLTHISEIVVQSAAAYSLVAVAEAICGVLPLTASDDVSWNAATAYTGLLFLFISGVAPTVLVARVAILDENDVYASSAATVSKPLSGLRFHVRSTQGDAESQPQLSETSSRVEMGDDPQLLEAVKEKGVSEEKGALSNELNSTILCVFLWGIYTIVYVCTLYLYFQQFQGPITLHYNIPTLLLTKKSSRNKLIVCAISLSYVAYSTLAIIVWYRDQSAVVNHSETRDTLFAALYDNSEWPIFVTDIMTFVMAAVADGILIWRCCNVCGRSLRVILVPGFLLFCEIVIDLVEVSVVGVDRVEPTPSQSNVINRLIAAQAFVTFATTFSSTSLIAYRIYSTTRHEISGNSKQLLMNILEILVQSAAAYSLLAIAYAISGVIPQTPSNVVSWNAAAAYANVLFTSVSGLAPTVLVARVAILDENDIYASTAPTLGAPSGLSGLRFHVRTTRDDEEAQSQLSERIDRERGKVEGPQVPEIAKEKDDLINIS
ncbi:LOW QUALITY PROTEIN: hypothetical protein CVT26_013344 [Gymnopilus dilepis]|uniref:Uncharacterized protein n=1 Tax=Gymnopilus dilepis TaxID=231916 RepID=A0A409YEY5_9AGAR|nr:LOW QUALITY PROTEIN: hypothetical protein CVT26_013344 [Gymnopilus dilepis]